MPYIFLLSIFPCQFIQAKDAKEVAADADGRWFAFKLETTSKLVLEKKNIPDHLSSLDCLDVPTTVDNVIRELEDEGEVIKPQTIQFLWMFDFFWLVSGDIMGKFIDPHWFKGCKIINFSLFS